MIINNHNHNHSNNIDNDYYKTKHLSTHKNYGNKTTKYSSVHHSYGSRRLNI